MFVQNKPADMEQKLKMGMVGGGGDATIGVLHRMAAQLDGGIELVAGAFSSNAERSRRCGERLGLHSARIYNDYFSMATEEAKLSKGESPDREFLRVAIFLAWTMASRGWHSSTRRLKA